MTNAEFGIPNIEERARTERHMVQDLLFEHASESGVVFIDDTLESSTAAIQYAEYLTHILGRQTSDEEFGVVYRSIHFMSLVTGLHGCNRGISLESLEGYVGGDFDDIREHIRSISDVYIEHYPMIMGYADAFMPEIDPSGKYGHLAETVAGLVGSQIEDGLRVQAARDAVGAWDGTVPDDL